MAKTISVLYAVLLLLFLSTSIAGASLMTFYTSPGTDPSGDLAFQTAALGLSPSNYLMEEDFETGFVNGQSVPGFSMGSITLDISLPGVGDAGEIFSGSYAGAAGGQPGTVYGNALLNRDPVSDKVSQALRIDFSGALVQGFGLWVFDNGQSFPDRFRMMAQALDGTTGTSEILDAYPGATAHTVEGFIGVTSLTGLDYVIIEDINQVMAFELDHFQVVVNPVPEPATMLFLGFGLVGLAAVGRRKFFKK